MSDELTGLVAEQVSEQVDVADMLGDGSLEESIDAEEIGSAVGREFGERVGREVGEAIGREIHVTIAEGIENERSLGEIRSDLTTAVRTAFDDLLTESGVSDSVESLAQGALGETGLEDALGDDEADADDEDESDETGIRETVESAAGEVTDDSVLDDVLESDEAEEKTDEDEAAVDAEAEEDDSEAVEDADEEGDDSEAEAAEDETAESADEEDDGPSVDDLEGLRTETLEDFLGVMSYQNLQSIAKDVDVKANLSREEMIDEIVATVTEDESESEAEAG
ncbi:hypothetical protein ACLI4Z_14110 [Natrialbaceae archaeon A-arb3/5]